MKLQVEELEPRCLMSAAVVPNIKLFNDTNAKLVSLQQSVNNDASWFGNLSVQDVLVSEQMTPSQVHSVAYDLALAQQALYASARASGSAAGVQYAAQQFLNAYNHATTLASRNYFAEAFNAAVQNEANFVNSLNSSMATCESSESAAQAILENFSTE